MKAMHMISVLMTNEYNLSNMAEIKSLEDSGIYDQLGTDRLINFTNERTSSNLPKQKLVCSMNVHSKVLNFVKNCTEIPEE